MEREQPYIHDKITVNVNNTERIISAGVGAFLVFNTIADLKKFSLAKLLAGGFLLYRGATGHCPMYSMLGKDNLPDPVKNINIRTSILVNKPRQEVYAFWRKLENLPLFMNHLENVTEIDSTRSRWKAWGPGGIGSIEWESEIVKDEPGRLLGWSSYPGADIENAGKIDFHDVGMNQTKLDVVITYRPPLKNISAGIARLLTPGFEKMIRADVENFKEYIEKFDMPDMQTRETEPGLRH